jgi:hypothetical protein
LNVRYFVFISSKPHYDCAKAFNQTTIFEIDKNSLETLIPHFIYYMSQTVSCWNKES